MKYKLTNPEREVYKYTFDMISMKFVDIDEYQYIREFDAITKKRIDDLIKEPRELGTQLAKFEMNNFLYWDVIQVFLNLGWIEEDKWPL